MVVVGDSQVATPTYPTEEHGLAAEAIARFYAQQPCVEAVLQVGSCARGRASRDSCLDLAVLVRPEVLSTERSALERQWEEFEATDPTCLVLRSVGKCSFAECDFTDGWFAPEPRGPTSGPDEFELAIGNYLVYGAPLWQTGEYLESLKARWLPYYDEWLRGKRLAEVVHFGRNNLGHIEPFVRRGLYFQAFRRLYDASREFVQALFVSRRVYPIAYDKWIREQVMDILGLPEVYRELVSLFEISHFESDELIEKARALERMYDQYVGL